MEVGAKVLVEFGDARGPAHQELRLALGADVLVFLDVELVVDLADDLLDHILDGDEPGNAAVFVDHDRHVVTVALEFLEQHVEPLGFRHEHRGPQELAHVELRRGLGAGGAQQIFCQQYSHHAVAIAVEHRKA